MRRQTLALLGICAAVAGCGTAGARSSSHRTTALIVDCSGSTTPFRAQWKQQVLDAAVQAVLRHDLVWIDCIDGEPLSNTTFSINVDGSQVPDSLKSNPTIATRYLRARAAALQPQISRLLNSTRRAQGSGLLDALEVVAGLHPSTLTFWTDGLLIQSGIDLNAPLSREAIDRLVRDSAARLRGLRGTKVTIVGLGRRAHNAASARRARTLLPAVLRAAGADVQMVPELPQSAAVQ